MKSKLIIQKGQALLRLQAENKEESDFLTASYINDMQTRAFQVHENNFTEILASPFKDHDKQTPEEHPAPQGLNLKTEKVIQP